MKTETLQHPNNIKLTSNLSEIAKIIKEDWTKIWFGAKPYVDAMATLTNINDNYHDDSAADVVRYFLANASTWRGSTARNVKKHLNMLLKNVE